MREKKSVSIENFMKSYMGYDDDQSSTFAQELERIAEEGVLLHEQSILHKLAMIKSTLRELWDKGSRQITGREVKDFLVQRFQGVEITPNEVGSLLGRGKGGLYLQSEKNGVRNVYLIPDPNLFIKWYQENVPLPYNYYSMDYLQRLILVEREREKTNFFRDRTEMN